MLALLRYHYRDAHIDRRMPEQDLLGLFAELEWVRQEELKRHNTQLQGATDNAS